MSNECLVAAYLDAIDTLTYAHELAEHRHSARLKAIAPLGVGVIVGVLLLSSATGWSPRRFSFRRSSLLAWRSSFFISRRSLRERSVGVTDEFGVGDANELGEGDADGSMVGRARSARGVGVATGALGLRLERDLSTGDRSKVGLAV